MADGQSTGAGAGRTGVCRHCGALVSAGEGRCMMCGTSVAPKPERAQTRRRARAREREAARFLRALVERPATFTVVFIVASVFLYLLMSLSGGATGDVLIAYGAKLNYLIDQKGQWWRFVTPIFLHIHLSAPWAQGPRWGWLAPLVGPLHLVLNMYGLFILGQLVERLYGSAKFVVFWVLTGMAGVVASYLTVQPQWAQSALGRLFFKPFDSPSAGASGALFGLMGVLFVFGIRYREELPEDFKRVFGLGLLPVLLLNLAIGYLWPGFAGNAPHVGGLLAGMGLALVVGYNRPGARAERSRGWQAAQAACLALVALSFVMVARHFNVRGPRMPRFAATLNPAAKRSFSDSINVGQSAFIRFLKGDDAGLAPAVEQLEHSPSLSPEADELREDLRGLLTRALEASNDRSLDAAGREQRVAHLSEEFSVWQESLARWIKDEGDGTLNIQKPEGQE